MRAVGVKLVFVVSLLLLFLMASGIRESLPAEPDVLSGRAIYAGTERTGYAEPTTFTINKDSLARGEQLTLSIQDEDYVYKHYYVLVDGAWQKQTFAGNPVGTSNWIRSSASASILTGELKEGKNYVLAYSCSRSGSIWDCHNNKWQIQEFEIFPSLPVPPSDQDCGSDQGCGYAQACVNYKCVPKPGTANADCPAAFYCKTGVCASLSGTFPSCHADDAENAPVCEVKLEVVQPEERQDLVLKAPTSAGVLFTRDRFYQFQDGTLTPMLLVDDTGINVPFEVWPTGWWESAESNPREVKWALLHFPAQSNKKYRVLVGPGVDGLASASSNNLASAAGDQISINTGSLQATMVSATPYLFQQLTPEGGESFSRAGELILRAHDGTNDIPTTLQNWNFQIEKNTPLYAVVKGTGVFKGIDNGDYAQLEVRLRFFKDESFVRFEHTFTWLLRPLDFGIRELSINFYMPDAVQTVHVGLDDYNNQETEISLADGDLHVSQNSASSYESNYDLTGERLGGWVEGITAQGKGLGIALRSVWQEYPKAFTITEDTVKVELWPADSELMSFREDAIMPPDFFCNFFWSNKPYATPNPDPNAPSNQKWCHGHEIPGTGGNTYHTIWGENFFEHTGEGVSKSHDVIISFPGIASARPTAELNSLLQHPLVVRQDPASALAVPFLGISLAPANWEKYGEIEQVIEDTARLSLARWESGHDYGFWRYGFLRWGSPGLGGWIYRWMDGTQYDLQIIPWALWMRGGDYDFYEEGLATARHGMDVSTNHYSTRELLYNGQQARICGSTGQVVEYWPAGFQKHASSMPFPAEAADGFLYQTKVHFLSLLYHLTGDERAKETMDTIISGAKVRAAIDYPAKLPHPGIRYGYNMNLFWHEAYMETWDQELLAPMEEWRTLLVTEFDLTVVQWKQPVVYAWHAMLEALYLYHDLGQDIAAGDQLKDILLQNLEASGMSDLDENMIYENQAALAAGWATVTKGDEEYVKIAFDLARSIADAQPRFVYDANYVPSWREAVHGNTVWRGVLQQMLVGVSEASRRNLDPAAIAWIRAVHTYVAVDSSGAGHLTAFLKPASTNDLPVDIRVTNSVTNVCAVPPTTVRVLHDGQPVLNSQGEAIETTITMQVLPSNTNPYPRRNPTQQGSLIIPNAQAGEIYTVEVEVAAPTASPNCDSSTNNNLNTRVRVDAGDTPLVVQYNFQDLDFDGAENLEFTQGDVCSTYTCIHAYAGEDRMLYDGSRLVLKTAEDTIRVWNPWKSPYTIRDANTGEELFRYATGTSSKFLEHSLGQDRLIVLTFRKDKFSLGLVGMQGVEPFVAFTPATWFDPGT